MIASPQHPSVALVEGRQFAEWYGSGQQHVTPVKAASFYEESVTWYAPALAFEAGFSLSYPLVFAIPFPRGRPSKDQSRPLARSDQWRPVL